MTRTRGFNIPVTNNSYGGHVSFNQTWFNAVSANAAVGTLFVASAGNGDQDDIGDNIDNFPFYPASFQLPNVISVAATDNDGALTAFSNFGAVSVDFAAPGDNILTTFPGNSYGYIDGTSFSAPYVAGTAALLSAHRSYLLYHEIRDDLIAGVDPMTMPQGKATRTNGRLNAREALFRHGRSHVVTGADSGGAPHVRVFFARTAVSHVHKFEFMAYATNFTGGVRVAAGDVNGDRTPDIITVPGPGGGPHVKVFNGIWVDDVPSLSLLREFQAYDPAFTGGLFVASGDTNADGYDEIVTAPNGSGGPHVKAFSGFNNNLLFEFLAYGAGQTTGVRLAVGDVNNDGKADVITGAGAGSEPRVKAFSGLNPAVVLRNFLAYDASVIQGIYVGFGRFDNDNVGDILTAPGAGVAPHVKTFSGSTGTLIHSFFAYLTNYTGGVRVAAVDVNNDGRDDILAGQGTGPNAKVRFYSGLDLTQFPELDPYGSISVGLFVGAKRRHPTVSPEP
jgi:hypothetical protein